MQEDWVTLWPHELLLCRQLWRNQTGPEGGILTGVPLPPGVPIAILANGGMYEMVITSTGVHVQADVALGALQGTILSAPLLLQTNCDPTRPSMSWSLWLPPIYSKCRQSI